MSAGDFIVIYFIENQEIRREYEHVLIGKKKNPLLEQGIPYIYIIYHNH